MNLPAVIGSLFGRWSDCAETAPDEINVAQFPRSNFSNKEIVRVGKALGGDMPYHPDRMEEYSHIFKVAYDFRDSHAYPMRRLRQELAGRIKRVKVSGLTAARTKRMESIRKKLSRISSTLIQIEDLGGCRAIVESMGNLNTVLDAYRQANGPHNIRKDRSYIETPKIGGYRSHHFVFEFKAGETSEDTYDGKRIEVQLRTRLQHSWATAVEAVGLLLNQDLKAGEGDANWLRLFELVSSEFAESEGCRGVPGTENIGARRAEILDLDKRLGARWFIRHWNLAIKETEHFIAPNSKYFVMQIQNNTLDVRGYNLFEDSASAEHGGRGTVIVEVDKVENLREAYPNYFLDMTIFVRNLDRIIEGRSVRSSLEDDEPQKVISVSVKTQDHSWLHSWRDRKK